MFLFTRKPRHLRILGHTHKYPYDQFKYIIQLIQDRLDAQVSNGKTLVVQFLRFYKGIILPNYMWTFQSDSIIRIPINYSSQYHGIGQRFFPCQRRNALGLSRPAQRLEAPSWRKGSSHSRGKLVKFGNFYCGIPPSHRVIFPENHGFICFMG